MDGCSGYYATWQDNWVLVDERTPTKDVEAAGAFDIMDVDNGFYMVKCEHLRDRETIISGGPWMMFDHYLAVSQWTSEFASPHTTIERTIIWIRFPGLSLLYYDESVLLALAATVGTPVKVDTNTLNVEKGCFACICVEIDLTKPMVGKVWVNDHWYKVQYEGLHIICATYGCYGHHSRSCSQPKPQGEKIPPATATVVGHTSSDEVQNKVVNIGT